MSKEQLIEELKQEYKFIPKHTTAKFIGIELKEKYKDVDVNPTTIIEAVRNIKLHEQGLQLVREMTREQKKEFYKEVKQEVIRILDQYIERKKQHD